MPSDTTWITPSTPIELTSQELDAVSGGAVPLVISAVGKGLATGFVLGALGKAIEMLLERTDS